MFCTWHISEYFSLHREYALHKSIFLYRFGFSFLIIKRWVFVVFFPQFILCHHIDVTLFLSAFIIICRNAVFYLIRKWSMFANCELWPIESSTSHSRNLNAQINLCHCSFSVSHYFVFWFYLPNDKFIFKFVFTRGSVISVKPLVHITIL